MNSVRFIALAAIGLLGATPATEVSKSLNSTLIVAAGDIACGARRETASGGSIDVSAVCHMSGTAALIAHLHPSAVLPLGDLQYGADDLRGFEEGYAKTWGRFRSISHPVIGNHEYDEPAAAGYFQYWGSTAGPAGKGWYSYDLPGWHMIALNGQCGGMGVGGCKKGSPQWQWLVADLRAHSRGCRLAYWHQPRFSTGPHGNNSDYTEFWSLLYAAHVDVVLNGHDHDYERFPPLNPQEKLDPNGIREFVVGTGGKNHSPFFYPSSASVTRQNTSFGVLAMTLYPHRYSWRYIAEPGATYRDWGSADCHRK
ncbi:MAG: metallophosphoesterase [Candidatus Eremiobacteraeota bacterium]|nr:metallophosphoesterase [Candidatus Eremiobacteraeota bacterium]MDQ6933674.1 metallophosphoesterase [Candidatus Eremiobacteraeota bacterium]